MLDRARREAVLRLKQEALQKGSTLVVNLKFETTNIGGGNEQGMPIVQVIAYGTALKPRAVAAASWSCITAASALPGSTALPVSSPSSPIVLASLPRASANGPTFVHVSKFPMYDVAGGVADTKASTFVSNVSSSLTVFRTTLPVLVTASVNTTD